MDANEPHELIAYEVVYDGERYDREGLQALVLQYQKRHEDDLERLAELRKTHDQIAVEMTRDLAEARSAWDYVKGMMTDDFGPNFRALLERIPVINELVANRPIADLLREKVEVAEQRTRQVGHFLTTVERSMADLADDVTRLNKKVIVAAHNEEKAARHVLDLKDLEARLAAELEAMDDKSAAFRAQEAAVATVRRRIWETGAELRLYSNAEDRIASIVAMNNNFLRILTHLYSNMQSLYDAGLEVLDELRGNLSGLTTAAQASELSLDMQRAMQSLKTSVNRVAVLASHTSLYLTQNIERLTSDMKLYDDATQALVRSNLDAEREIQEQRINDTIALAEKEYGLMRRAREAEG